MLQNASAVMYFSKIFRGRILPNPLRQIDSNNHSLRKIEKGHATLPKTVISVAITLKSMMGSGHFLVKQDIMAIQVVCNFDSNQMQIVVYILLTTNREFWTFQGQLL